MDNLLASISGVLTVQDAIFIAGGFALFFVGILYVFACDRL